MAISEDWAEKAAEKIAALWKGDTHGRGDGYITDEQRAQLVDTFNRIIQWHCPFKKDVAYTEAVEPPLLQCSDCHNTESCAGAMARHFNHGRCLRCGGYFKVIRA